MDAVFKALADTSRRQLLDSLSRRGGQSLRELCADLAMTRQAVSKHLAVLEDAGLVATVRHGLEKLHYLNPVPIHEIYERWISKYERGLAGGPQQPESRAGRRANPGGGAGRTGAIP